MMLSSKRCRTLKSGRHNKVTRKYEASSRWVSAGFIYYSKELPVEESS